VDTARRAREEAPIMAKLLSPEEWVNKMMSRAQGAGADWKSGLERARGTITSNMKKSAGRYKSEMQKSLAEDRWSKSIANLSDDQIIAAATAGGDSAWLAGLTNRTDKVRAALTRLHSKLQAHVDKINAMPAETDEQRKQKMLANLEGMKLIGQG
jgi:hypothetical protein